MTAVWFVGDLHFGHQSVAERRGFDTAYAHDVAIATDWQMTVRKDDIVYVMGDISSGSSRAEAFALLTLHHLPGRKRLIAGNHDSIAGVHRRPSPNRLEFARVFEQINDYARIRTEKRTILLSHYPYASQGDGPGRFGARYLQYRLEDRGALLVHAHTHHKHPTDGSYVGREYCVSWDAARGLVPLSDITAWAIRAQKEPDA